MNRFEAVLKKKEVCGSLELLEFDFFNEKIYISSLGKNYNLNIGEKVFLSIAPENIFLIKDFNIYSSFSNQIKSSIIAIEKGECFTKIECAINGVIFESLMRTKIFNRIHIEIGDSVVLVFSEMKLFLENSKKIDE